MSQADQLSQSSDTITLLACFLCTNGLSPESKHEPDMQVCKLIALEKPVWTCEPSRASIYGWHLVPNVATNMNLFQEKFTVLSLKKSGSTPAERSMEISALERGLKFFQSGNRGVPAAVHSIVVQSPNGAARTYKLATKTVELPAQQGERVTIVLASSNAFFKIGPLQFAAAAPTFKPGEPMSLTNHVTGQESLLLRAPTKSGSSFLLNPSFLIPTAAFLATGDVASGVIDPSLPKLIPVVAVASLMLGTAVNNVVLPQLKKLPVKMVDVVALKQQLLSQYDLLQNRIRTLRQAVEKEIWMLARMCQLENKIVSVGEPSYRIRRNRVKKVRESLESSLIARLELIDSYAKISSMIEIEVEMDSDVLAAESVSNAESIAEQIEQMMELEDLEERWRIQAEANDEVERLLSTPPISTEVV